MKNTNHLAAISLLALSAIFLSTACTNVDTDEQDLSAGDVEEGDENLGEAEDELVYSCSNVSNANWPDGHESFEAAVLAKVNQKRAAGASCNGVWKPAVPALTQVTSLNCAGRSHSKNMGEQNFFSHTGSDGTSSGQRFTQAGYAWTASGENIAAGQTTPDGAVTSWMNSKTGHCEAIMSPTYKNFGAGYYYKSTASYKHYWTLTLAKP